MHLVGSLLDCIDAFDPDTVGSDPSIQAGSGLRCGRYRGPPRYLATDLGLDDEPS